MAVQQMIVKLSDPTEDSWIRFCWTSPVILTDAVAGEHSPMHT